MFQTPNHKSQKYDLEQRTFEFARSVSQFIKNLPKGLSNIEYGKQVIRSSGSVGANYIEANEALSRKDFLMRIKICRKEAKESGYWLCLVEPLESGKKERDILINESVELMKIFGSIVVKSRVSL